MKRDTKMIVIDFLFFQFGYNWIKIINIYRVENKLIHTI